MEIDILLTDETDLGLKEDFFKKIAETTFKYINVNADKVQISLLLTDDDEMKKINYQYRNIDKPTDVLSFPMFESIDDVKGEVLIGDIVISGDTLKKQAIDNNVSINREAAFLFIHGLLHLLCYHHEEDDTECEMFDMQEDILKMLIDNNIAV